MQQLDLPTLTARLEHASFGQRQTLVQEVAQAATPEQLAAITRLLGHPVEAVRIGAIEILEAAQFRQALRHLAAVTVQRQGQERTFAARAVAALALAQDRALLEPVARAWLREKDAYLAIHASALCAKLGIEAQDAGAVAQPASAQAIAAQAIAAASEGPIAGITSPDAAVREQAIARTVAALDHPAEVLVEGLFDTGQPGIRLDLATALATLELDEVAPVLMRIMKRGDPDLLALVARALEPRLGEASRTHRAELARALEYGRGRVFDHGLARTAIDACLARLQGP